jgi:FtsP/CotA-like multicopper oxidase with cupredoxin domain
MHPFHRVGIVAFASLATTAAGLAAAVHPPLAHPAVAAGAPTAPCIPTQPTPVPGVSPARIPLPQPPLQDTTQPGHGNFTLYVKANADGSHFCYTTTPNGQLSYVEAPTIVVARGGTFRMTLINQIPAPSSPSPVPTPPRRAGVVDGCAWLPYEGETLPEPTPPTPAPGYFNHPRAEHPGMPPWMASNDTNFHTHGWHVSPYVDNVFKSMVYAPTPNTCVFTFEVRTSQPPGTYWYHSHMHGFSSTQVGGGLAGALIVVPNAPNFHEVLLSVKNAPIPQTGAAALKGTANAMGAMGEMGAVGQESLIRHYARVFSRPQPLPSAAAAASPQPFDPFNPPPWYAPAPIPTAYCPALPTAPSQVGALGVNGALIPVVINGVKTPATGPSVDQLYRSTVRYRLLNASANSYLNLALTSGSSRVRVRVIARDGVPVNWDPATNSIDPNKPAVIEEPNVFLAPSNRVDFIVTMSSSATVHVISLPGTPTPTGPPPSNTPYCMGYDGFAIPQLEILTINSVVFPQRSVTAATVAVPKAMHAPTVAGAFAARAKQAGIPRRAITFTQYPAPGGPPEWYVTQTAPLTPAGAPPPPPVFTERPFFLAPGHPPTAANPYVPQIQVRQNSTEEWDIFNAAPEIHAFHIHQLTFVAVQSPFEATDPYRQVFLDSIPLPAAKLAPPDGSGVQKLIPSVTKIVIDFHHVDTGIFVFHCHMLFHEDHGMMGIVQVLPPLTGAKT